MCAQSYVSAEEVRQALRQIYRNDSETNLQNALLSPWRTNSNLSTRRAAGNPARCSFSRSFSCALWLVVFIYFSVGGRR